MRQNPIIEPVEASPIFEIPPPPRNFWAMLGLGRRQGSGETPAKLWATLLCFDIAILHGPTPAPWRDEAFNTDSNGKQSRSWFLAVSQCDQLVGYCLRGDALLTSPTLPADGSQPRACMAISIAQILLSVSLLTIRSGQCRFRTRRCSSL